MKKILLLVLVTTAIMLSGTIKADAALPQNSNMSTAETLYYSGEFCKFYDLLERADLNRVLKGRGPYTVFAPSDAALANVPQDMLNKLAGAQNQCELERAMRYHIVSDCVSCQQLAAGSTIKTTDGRCVCAGNAANAITLNNARIVQSVNTNNGVIHVIDNILLPSDQLSLR
ncbi:MAG: hypothetical protein A2Y25_02580 [Candidatus Melainabacteria bacterium GWF2_37_15]|nr:MAG: hypothetical protein A2Y25_02580 [Candidatus Melainabacteria bacterium GWF2_37_15]